MEENQFAGVMPALMTPFDAGQNVAYSCLENFLNYLIGKGVSGVYLTGSTGEGFMMHPEERNEFVRAVVALAKGKLKVIAHTGAISTRESIRLSESAEAAGVDAISSVPPFYYKFSSAEILSYYREVAGATSLPFFVYNIPATTGVEISLQVFETLLQVKNIVGLKYTSNDIFTMERILRLPCRPIVFSGADEMSFYGLWAGAQALVGSSYNLLADVVQQMYTAFRGGDYPRAHLQYRLGSELLATLLKFPYMAAVRTVLKWEGCDIGMPRRPFAALDAEQERELRSALRAVVRQYPEGLTSLAQSL